MQLKPVKRYQRPKYPTQLQVWDQPELLKQHVPAAWIRKTELMGLMGLFLVVSCQLDQDVMGPELKATDAAVVAPLFKNGSGTASMGCMIMNPPVFLSEEEAIHVIMEELKIRGIEITDINRPISALPVKHNAYFISDPYSHGRIEIPEEVKPLEVDGFVETQKIAVEFVSYRDHRLYSPQDNDNGGLSISSLDFKAVAEHLNSQVAETGKGHYFASFYDPVSYSTEEDKEAYDAWGAPKHVLAERSKNYLRQQVSDFADWLRAQGVM
ncbi:hypothetical protein KAR48_19825 [bacterium]|nr:hypothetical protein [bacterium]